MRIFKLMMLVLLSVGLTTIIFAKPNKQQQKEPTTDVLPKGLIVVGGDVDTNDLYIIGENEPMPILKSAVVAAQKFVNSLKPLPQAVTANFDTDNLFKARQHIDLPLNKLQVDLPDFMKDDADIAAAEQTPSAVSTHAAASSTVKIKKAAEMTSKDKKPMVNSKIAHALVAKSHSKHKTKHISAFAHRLKKPYDLARNGLPLYRVYREK